MSFYKSSNKQTNAKNVVLTSKLVTDISHQTSM